MDDTVNKKLLESQFGKFSTEGIKAGENNDLRCIINNDINSGSVFKCLDIASFTTNDATLEFIALDMNNGKGVFGSLLERDALNGGQECFFSQATCFLLSLFVYLVNGALYG